MLLIVEDNLELYKMALSLIQICPEVALTGPAALRWIESPDAPAPIAMNMLIKGMRQPRDPCWKSCFSFMMINLQYLSRWYRSATDPMSDTPDSEPRHPEQHSIEKDIHYEEGIGEPLIRIINLPPASGRRLSHSITYKGQWEANSGNPTTDWVVSSLSIQRPDHQKNS